MKAKLIDASSLEFTLIYQQKRAAIKDLWSDFIADAATSKEIDRLIPFEEMESVKLFPSEIIKMTDIFMCLDGIQHNFTTFAMNSGLTESTCSALVFNSLAPLMLLALSAADKDRKIKQLEEALERCHG